MNVLFSLAQCTFGKTCLTGWLFIQKNIFQHWFDKSDFFSQNFNLLRTELAFFKMNCNALMHSKIHFTDIYQSALWINMVYYTKSKLSRIYNRFTQTTHLGLRVLFKGFLQPSLISYLPLNSSYPAQQYILNPWRSHLVLKTCDYFLPWIPASCEKTHLVTNSTLKMPNCWPKPHRFLSARFPYVQCRIHGLNVLAVFTTDFIGCLISPPMSVCDADWKSPVSDKVPIRWYL